MLIHNTLPEEERQFWKVKAHEVRALATSLLFKHNHSVKDVMAQSLFKRCNWRSNSTFVSFYLRETNHHFLDMSSFDKVVAAQTVIPSTSQTDGDQRNLQPSVSRKKEKKRGGTRHRKNNATRVPDI